ncbi:hypothetical protein [Sedimentibacter saalensis]|uniref:Uncharacterized protein n=1 Tax=Sedimentibacter saalensis TaxID=130788 RepID=A0A562J5J2_9FIRM|nr:hypothetical protein [Sedimentibacter saalensis]TWH78155.1 hypothetical protein LY60_02996 [Sedimentibacter saalensis]
MKWEHEFATALFNNAVIFLNEAVGFINLGLNERRNIVLSIVNIQIAIELALKSSIVNYYGVRTVLMDPQSRMTDEEIEKLFRENRLKLKEYNMLKNFTKTKDANIEVYNFEKTQYKHMEQFQKYRNQILHSSYIFSDEEIKKIEQDIIYVLIHIMGILMSDSTDYEYKHFMQEYLNGREYSKLLHNPIYNRELYEFLENEYDKLYTCPYCSTRTVTPYKYCARCLTNFDVSKDIFAFVKCGWCGEEMVICDSGNIEYNNNMIKGLCLNCGEDTIVYKCHKCHDFVNVELFDKSDCCENYCKRDTL